MRQCWVVLIALAAVGWGKTPDKRVLAKNAEQVLRTQCYRCHGLNGDVAGKAINILNYDRSVSTGIIVPGDVKSPILNLMDAGQMPLGVKKLPDSDIDAVREWIRAGAPRWDVKEPAGIKKMVHRVASWVSGMS